MTYYYTNYPFNELGDIPHQQAPLRKVKLIDFDGDKWCKVEVERIVANVKYFHLRRLTPLTFEQLIIDFDEGHLTNWHKDPPKSH